MDFKKAFDSVNRSIMLCKLKEVGLPGKVIRAIWPIIRENFVQITTAECLSNSVTQNVGLAQGECLSPLLYSILGGCPFNGPLSGTKYPTRAASPIQNASTPKSSLPFSKHRSCALLCTVVRRF